ncbi:hypothetical protein Tco_0191612 [Tanacetum coccineum]
MHNLTTMNLSTSSVHRYKDKREGLVLVMWIRQHAILFYQHHPYATTLDKDHPLEQVIGNPSQLVRTRKRLDTDGEMKKLHSFDRQMYLNYVDRPLCNWICSKLELIFEESFSRVAKVEMLYVCSLRMRTQIILQGHGLELSAFLDSDHAGCLASRKSTSGGIQFLGGDKFYSHLVQSVQLYRSKAHRCQISLHKDRLKRIDLKYLVRRLGLDDGVAASFQRTSKSKDKGSKSRSQSMDEQSHYKQDKTITRQSINVKCHIFDVISGTDELRKETSTLGEIVSS